MAGGTKSRLGASPEEGIKAPCLVESIGDLTLYGLQTVNGVALADNDRVIVKNQTTVSENGIYIAKVGAAWHRASDFHRSDDVLNGVLVISQETSTIYQIQVAGFWTPDTTDVTFNVLFAIGGTATWGSIVGTLSNQTDLQVALDGKVDDAQVLTNVPSGAVFTDTIYTHPNHSGDVVSTGDGVMVIQSGVVTPTMQADILTNRVVGRLTAGTGAQEQLTGTQLTTMLNAFTSLLPGLVGASGGGTANFLRSDGSWVDPIGTYQLGALQNVTITTVTDNEILAYDNGTSEWINQTAAEAGLALASDLTTHTGDATIHFTQGAISIPLSQGANDVTATAAEVNLLDLAGLTTGWALLADSATTASWQVLPTYAFGEYVGEFNATTPGTFPVATNQGDWFNCTVAGTIDSQPFVVGDTLIALVDSPSTTVFAANWSLVPAVGGVTDHTGLTNIGTNTHAQIDTHIADATLHFTQAAISITHSQISDFDPANYLLDTTDTLTGDLTVTGNINTSGLVSISDTAANLGTSGTNYTLRHVSNVDSLVLAGGITGSIAARLVVYGGTHATRASDFVIQAQGASVVDWDESAGELILRTGAGVSKTAALTLDGSQNATFAGDVAANGNIEQSAITGDSMYLSSATATESNIAWGLDATATRVIQFDRTTAAWAFGKGTTKDTITTEYLNFNSVGNATFAGDVAATGAVTGSNLAIANWNTAFGWGDHSGTYSLLAHTHLLAAGATDVTATAAEVNLLDLSGLTAGWVLSADTLTTASWKAPAGGGVTDHTALTSIGTNTHVQIDTHLALVNAHIDWKTGTETGFNSIGFDDNATLLKATLTDTALSMGGVASGDFRIGKAASDGRLLLSGGNATTTGVIALYGDNFIGNPGDIKMYGGGDIFFDWFEGGGSLSINTGVGISKNLAAQFDSNQKTFLYGDLDVTGKAVTSISTTSRAGFNIQEGVAPTAPVNGDVWVTAAGEYFARLNGVSVDLATSGVTDHTLLSNIGTNTHAQIDTHIADATIHFTQAAISITASQISDFDPADYLLDTTDTLTGDLTVTGDIFTGNLELSKVSPILTITTTSTGYCDLIFSSGGGAMSAFTADEANGLLNLYKYTADHSFFASEIEFTETGTIVMRAGGVNTVSSAVTNLTLSGASGSELATFAGDVTVTADVAVGAGLRLTERSDHSFTPTATFGELWLKDGTQQALTFTDDAGADYDLMPRRKNILINGDFDVWQRGTSFAAAAAATYSADRLMYTKIGTMVHTLSRSTDVPTQAQSGHKSNYSLLVDCTTADVTIAPTDVCYITQKIEGYNFRHLEGNTITISFWVKGTKTGIHCVALQNTAFDRSYVVEYTIDATATWEKKTITITLDYSGGTWDYTSGIGLRLVFTLVSGTTRQTTANAWATGDFVATSNQVTATDSVANDFRIAQVQLEKGSAATEFEHSSIGEELELCQRYYVSRTGDNNREVYSGDVSSSSTYYHRVTFQTSMRDNPTIVTSSLTSVSGFPSTAPTVADISPSGFRMAKTTAGGGGMNGAYYHAAYTADAEL
jgi:hypothetical protein